MTDGPTPPVLVTGGSGFVASHVVRELLERGHRVRATVRDLSRSAKLAPLRALQATHPGRLDLFEADLLREGSFDRAMHGCRWVFHVACPFLIPGQIRDSYRDVLEPAMSGTGSVLGSVRRTMSVDRVVLTSTVGTLFGDYTDVLGMPDRTLTEEHWNTSSTLDSDPAHYAKTSAERLAWELAGGQTRWSLVVVNPGLVLGPTLGGTSDSGSLFLMDELMRGAFFYGSPNFSFPVVDVRDLAAAHVLAAATPSAHGRYIIARPEMVSFAEMAAVIRGRHPWRLTVPRHRVPDLAVRVLGQRFGLSRDYIARHLGIRFAVDNRRGLTDLGLTYRPVEETVLDHFETWRAARRRTADATSA